MFSAGLHSCKTGLMLVGGKEKPLKIGSCLSKAPLKLSLLKPKLVLQAERCTESSAVLRRGCFLKMEPIVQPSIVCNLDNS